MRPGFGFSADGKEGLLPKSSSVEKVCSLFHAENKRTKEQMNEGVGA
jgi:hypothetical protein